MSKWFAASGWAMALTISALGCDGGDSGGGSGGDAGSSGSTGPQAIDACAIVTQADATALFGQPAEKDPPSTTVDRALVGSCNWAWKDAQANSHLLQLSIWSGKSYYAPSTGAQPFAIGDEGALSTDPTWGVDVTWRQGETVLDLSYSTVGSVPKATTKVDAVKALALSAASKIK